MFCPDNAFENNLYEMSDIWLQFVSCLNAETNGIWISYL